MALALPYSSHDVLVARVWRPGPNVPGPRPRPLPGGGSLKGLNNGWGSRGPTAGSTVRDVYCQFNFGVQLCFCKRSHCSHHSDLGARGQVFVLLLKCWSHFSPKNPLAVTYDTATILLIRCGLRIPPSLGCAFVNAGTAQPQSNPGSQDLFLHRCFPNPLNPMWSQCLQVSQVDAAPRKGRGRAAPWARLDSYGLRRTDYTNPRGRGRLPWVGKR